MLHMHPHSKHSKLCFWNNFRHLTPTQIRSRGFKIKTKMCLLRGVMRDVNSERIAPCAQWLLLPPPQSRKREAKPPLPAYKSRIKPWMGRPVSNSLPVLSQGEEGLLFTLWYPRLCSFSCLHFVKAGIKADTKLPAMIHTLSRGEGPLQINRPNTCWTSSLRIGHAIH